MRKTTALEADDAAIQLLDDLLADLSWGELSLISPGTIYGRAYTFPDGSEVVVRLRWRPAPGDQDA